MRKWLDGELEESLLKWGQITPAFAYGGHIYDGNRRRTLCLARGIEFRCIEASNWEELLSLVFGSEPKRAIELAGKHSIEDYAEIFGVNQRSVIAVLRDGKPDVKAVRAVGQATAMGHECKVHFWSTHRFRALTQQAAYRTKRSMADYIRTAVEQQIKIDLPQRMRQEFEATTFTGKNHRDPKRARQG